MDIHIHSAVLFSRMRMLFYEHTFIVERCNNLHPPRTLATALKYGEDREKQKHFLYSNDVTWIETCILHAPAQKGCGTYRAHRVIIKAPVLIKGRNWRWGL